MARRVQRLRDRLIADHGESTVLVVSHVTPIKTLLRLALGAGASVLYRLHLDLASLGIAEFYPDDGASVRLVNDTSYLRICATETPSGLQRPETNTEFVCVPEKAELL